MELKDLYREIVNEHNLRPSHKGQMADPDLVLRGVNPSCGDDITLQLKLSAKEEAIKSSDLFMGMIKGEVTDEEQLEELDEATALQDVSHMPARVKCAVLGWRTMKEILENPEKNEK